MSRGYWKRRKLVNLSGKNPSLKLFIDQLDALGTALSRNAGIAPEGEPELENTTSSAETVSLDDAVQSASPRPEEPSALSDDKDPSAV